jgi:hypothetical protein
MLAPLESAQMKEFREFLVPINALAESSPGFLWRYTEGADVQEDIAEKVFGDHMIIVNLSVWESVEALREFTYKTVHSYFVRKRGRWFSGLDHPHLACWWVEPGSQPTVAEAKRRLELLERDGVGPRAFTLGQVR